MRQTRLLRGAALGAIGAAAACIYTFNNPVTAQSAGTVSGDVQLVGAAPGQTAAGTRVDLLWSNLSIDLGASGQFTFLDLPDGTYTLRYTVPPATAAGVPAVGELLDIYLPYTSAAAPDTIALGSISVSAPGTVAGTITVDGGAAAGVVVGAFVPNGDGGAGEYEGYSTLTDSSGHYTLLLPHGDHAIWSSSTSEAASLAISALQPGENRGGQDLALGIPELPTSQLTGYVVVDPEGAHADQSVVEPLLTDPFTVALDPPCTACQTRLSFGTAAPAQGVTAAQVAVIGVPAGVLYDVVCTLPSTNPVIPPVVLRGIPIIAGQSTTLKQIFMLTQTTLDANNALSLDGGVPVDAGADAGADAGFDGGVDAGFDGGLDAGFDAGPDAGPLDAGPACGVPADAGTAGWTLVGQVADPADGTGVYADAVVPLPLLGGAHSLVFSESTTGIYAVDDRFLKFGSAVLFWDGGSEVAGTLTGATFEQGGQNFVAWSTLGTAVTAPVYIAQAAEQIDAGPWTVLPTKGLSPLWSGGSQPLATVYDPGGGIPWLVDVTSLNDIELAPLTGPQALSPTDLGFTDAGLIVEGLAATGCEDPTSGATAICIFSYGSASGLTAAWLTTFDLATQLSNSLQVYPPASTGSPQILGAGIAEVGCGQLELGVSLNEDGPSQYLFATDTGGQVTPFTAIAPLGFTPPGLFGWRGSALLINEDSTGSFEEAISLGPWLAPPFPADAGFAPNAPHGYIDSLGAVYVGLINVTNQVSSAVVADELNLYRLSP